MSVPGYGPKNAKIAIVGEAPGVDEVREGKPFVGKSGQLLRNFLLQSGIDPESVYYTNLCKERPPGNDLKQWFKDGIPAHPAVELGLLELADELREVNPNVILGVGNYPLAMLTGKARWMPKLQTYSGIQDWRGSIVESTLPGAEGIKTICTWHPAFIIREGYGMHGIWNLDLMRAREQSLFPEIRKLKKHIVIDPRGEERVDAHLRLLNDMSATLTFDIEYIGNKLLCVGMTTHRDEAYVFVTKDAGDISFVREILCSGIPLCAQNSMFDCSILEWWFNIPCMKYLKYDTMLAAHAANIELPKDLGTLTSIYTEQPFYKDMVDWDKIKKGQQPLEDVWLYNGIDTWVTHQIMEEQLKDDLSDPKVKEVADFEVQLLDPLWQVSKRGMRVDVDKLKSLRLQLELEIREYEELLYPLAGDLNVKSGPQVAAFLFDKLGVPEGGRTPGGQRKTDDTTLAACLAKCTNDLQRVAVETIRDLRERRDLISKFCEIELEPDGRMRGHYNPGGTDTGRLASKKFYPTGRGTNQQNIPRDKRVRSVFIADPRKRFGYADLERAELYAVAHISGDLKMMENLKPGVNAHKMVGSYLFNVDPSQISDDQYYLSKRTGHAGNYMLGPKHFMEMVNADASKTGISITWGQAKELLTKYKEYYSRLPQWWDDTKRQLYATRKLYNLLGRPRTFYNHIDSVLPNAVAFRPQSTVGDTLNVALLNLEGVICPYIKRFREVEEILELSFELKNTGFEILNQVHDAVGFQYYEEHEAKVIELMPKLMSVPLLSPAFGELFTIPVEIMVGPNWGEVKKVA